MTLDALSAHWRAAFRAAEESIRCAGYARFDPHELHERAHRLTQERGEVARLLDAVARDEHAHLRRSLTAPPATIRMLGLSSQLHACVFDLDGVLTASATLHAAAWKEAVDEFLVRWHERAGERFGPLSLFDPAAEYYTYIHGKPRLDGVQALLASRGISVPVGKPGDPPDAETAYGLAARKNDALGRLLEGRGVEAYEGSQRYLEAAREARVDCAVVSPSANTGAILDLSGLAGLIGQQVDGNTIHDEHLHSKPEPDTTLAACRKLGVPPPEVAAFETTVAGITAARAAGVGLVIAVDRAGRPEALSSAGADRVVRDLAELLDPALAA
jgi:beta-phosphoglucomutase-like phosphatase (HAD superfamily)